MRISQGCCRWYTIIRMAGHSCGRALEIGHTPTTTSQTDRAAWNMALWSLYTPGTRFGWERSLVLMDLRWWADIFLQPKSVPLSTASRQPEIHCRPAAFAPLGPGYRALWELDAVQPRVHYSRHGMSDFIATRVSIIDKIHQRVCEYHWHKSKLFSRSRACTSVHRDGQPSECLTTQRKLEIPSVDSYAATQWRSRIPSNSCIRQNRTAIGGQDSV